MKAFFLALAMAVAALGSVSAPVDAATGERRIALVVGNSRYADAPLKNPANDARAMAASLRERGFEVIVRVDATKTQMETAIIEFGEKLTEGATGLFFFAGHGMQVQGRNYMIPTDAKLSSEQRIRLETIDIDAVLDQMQGARSKVNVVILDACRNNPFERRFRSASGGLAQINAPEGTLIAYATAPGRVAADGDGTNGLYTAELLKAVNTPGMKIEDVFKQVRVNVARASNGAQTPWEASSLVGDFYFTAPVAPVVSQAVPTPSNAAEVEFWNAIKSSTNPDEFKAYLAQYPNGQFAALVRVRLEAAEKARLVATASPQTDTPRLAAVRSPTLELDGKYQTVLSSVTWNNADIAAVMEINGTRITGSAFHEANCPFTGRIKPDGTAEIRIDCQAVYSSSRLHASAIVVELEGRFGPVGDNTQIAGETTFRSSDRRTGKAIWRRVSQ
jgi:hypothetical protein